MTTTITTDLIADQDVTTAKIADGAVNTAKIANTAVTDAKLAATLDLSGKTLTFPTSAKGIAQYSGATVFTGSVPLSFTDLDLSSTIGANRALVRLRIVPDVLVTMAFRTNGVTRGVGYNNTDSRGGGHTYGSCSSGNEIILTVLTDTSGIVEWIGDAAGSGGTTIALETYTLL